MNRSRIFAFLTVVFCLWAFCASAANRTTRDLVFEDDDATNASASQEISGAATNSTQVNETQTQAIGVKTTILLTRDGKTSTVLPSHEFKSGDSLKLVFTPSIDGYVYWMSKGTSGNYTVLFPSAKAGTDNKVVRNEEYTIPAQGSFRFDDKVGKEELLCILSEQRLPDFEKALENGSKDVDSKQVASVEQKNTEQRKTRDLVFEDDNSGDVNTQKQVAPKGEPFVAHYVLTHE